MQAIRSNTPLRLLALAASAAGLASLTGCAGFSGSPLSGASANAVTLPKGSVHGGQAPIVGAHVYVLSISTSGYQPAVNTPPNTSLIASGAPGTGTDAQGTYVTTDASGGVYFGGGIATCPSGDPEIYLLATGGNPGQAPGTDNAAIALMAVLGPCSTISASTFVNINEVSTVAAVTALRPFLVDGTHVGAGSSPAAKTGLANAVKSISNMIDVASGTALAVTPAASGGNGTVPQAEINTIANILAPCVNSASAASSDCSSLFSAAVPASGGTAPTDSIGAALLIATNPDSKVPTLFGLAPAAAPYQPTLNAAPNDFTIGITYKIPSTPATGPATLGQPGQLAIDALGDVWTANCQSCVTSGAMDYISEFGPAGNFIASYTNAGIHTTQGIALDSTGALWSANQAVGSTVADQITKMTPAGTLASHFPIDAVSPSPAGIAIDASDNAWVTSTGSQNPQGQSDLGTLSKVSPSGTVLASLVTPLSGVNFPVGVAIDAGNIFIADADQGSILEVDSTDAVTAHSADHLLIRPLGLAFDASARIWSVNNDNSVASIVTNAPSPATNQFQSAPGSPYTHGIYQASTVAIDGAGVVWIANCRASCATSGSTAPDNVIALNPDGSLYNGHNGINGYQNPGFNAVGTTAIDESGNVWISNSNIGLAAATGTITELIGVATPVTTPLAVATSAGRLGLTP